MPTSVVMPALELAQETGKVVAWLKAPGDRVQQGEPLVEIETDKVTTEIEAPASGILGEVTAREGDVVPVGRTIAVILDGAEAGAPAAAPAGGAGSAAAAVPRPVEASPAGGRAAARPAPAGVATGSGAGPARAVERAATGTPAGAARRPAGADDGRTPRPLASPRARRLAAERGLDLAALRGSGPEGAVLAADVLATAPPAAAVAPGAAAPGVAAPAVPAPPGVGTVWRIMAERMTASWTGTPHFYLFREVDASRLATWRDRAREASGARLTYTDLLVKLVAAALRRHPGVNAAWRDGAIVRNADVDVGLAVAVDDGLVVPVLRRADTLGLAEIAAAREDLVGRAQAGRLRPADIQGGGFTISNLGMYGVDAFQAILNPPQAAILAVGRVAERVVAVGGQPAVRPTMMLTLSCDHRALDGARGAQFLATLAGLIEEPLALLA
jgi:pyruvate dehydrogenase E2 component (dihydrolipoamide acetyltransferase)